MELTGTPPVAPMQKRKIMVQVGGKSGSVTVRLEGQKVIPMQQNCSSGCTFDAFEGVAYQLSAVGGWSSKPAEGPAFQGACAGTVGQVCTLPANGEQKVSLFF